MSVLEDKRALLSCPGDTIQETIDEIGMSQKELAVRLGRSIPKLNELIKGKAPLTQETAQKLEYVLDIPTSFWLKLERFYQDEIQEIKRLEFLEECTNWLKKFPIRKMKQLQLLPQTNEKPILAENLLKYFRVASPAEWSNIYKGSSLVFKIELRHTTEAEAISVWLRFGELQAEKIVVHSFDKKLIKERLGEIRTLVYEKPIDWLEKLQTICAECGIALVYTPCISKAPIFGATRWIKNGSTPLLQITDRRKDYNSFWFTFYHELAHVLFHGKKDIFIDGLDEISQDVNKEKEADDFAARMLLSEKDQNEINKYNKYSKDIIIELSKSLKKHPSIVIAYLQRENLVNYNFTWVNKMKEKVVFEEE